jgi:hypothetical protein
MVWLGVGGARDIAVLADFRGLVYGGSRFDAVFVAGADSPKGIPAAASQANRTAAQAGAARFPIYGHDWVQSYSEWKIPL